MVEHNRKHFCVAFPSSTLAAALAVLLVSTVFGVGTAQAQTFNVIYAFTGGTDGAGPLMGVTLDRSGNLYGTTGYGGTTGNGTVFRLSNTNSGWVVTPLYEFQGGSDGSTSNSSISIGRDGALYGATLYGGGAANCGTVFKLQPSPMATASASGYWNETILHSFTGNMTDGCYPGSNLTWDQAGNFYGTTQIGGANGYNNGFQGYGTIYKLAPSGSGWTESILYSFLGGDQGNYPLYSPIVFDNAGNIYGTVNGGGYFGGACEVIGCGLVYQLTNSGGNWTETVLHAFQDGEDGEFPNSGVILDSSGNLYGGAGTGGSGLGGTIFQLTPSSGGWNLNVLVSLQQSSGGAQGVESPLTFDSQGNLYGVTNDEGPYSLGTLFKLTYTSSGWIYTDLHDFTGGNDGALPVGPVVFDSQGNLYAVAILGGSHGAGVVFQVTPN